MTEPTPTYNVKTTVGNATPEWVRECVVEWRDRLLLSHWGIRISTHDAPGGEDNLAIVELFPEIFRANITLRSDVPGEPDDEWQKTIIHEMVHVRLAEISEFVRDDVLPELGPAAERIAGAAFRRALEPTVEALAHTLWALSVGAQECSVGAPTEDNGR